MLWMYDILYIVFVLFCKLSILYIVYYFYYYLCLVLSLSFCYTVELHQNKVLVCVNIPGNKANSDSDYKNPLEKLEGTSRELVFKVLVRF